MRFVYFGFALFVCDTFFLHSQEIENRSAITTSQKDDSKASDGKELFDISHDPKKVEENKKIEKKKAKKVGFVW